jgi:iron complex transport system substrate-binding protein
LGAAVAFVIVMGVGLGAGALAEGGAAYPIEIKHAFGVTVLEDKPERVATVAFGNQDVALALGVVPVGFSAANFGVQDDSGMLPWTRARLAELGVESPNVFQDTDGLDYEAISDCQPDVILAAYSGITQEEYDLLSQIAPVVAYPDTPWTISWRDWITYTALGIGAPDEGERLIAELEAMIAEKTARYDAFAGKTFVWISFNENNLSNLHAYAPVDPRCAFLIEDLGFSYPESVQSLVKDNSYSLSLSAENADLLYDADFLIGYSSESAYAAAKADPVLGNIPALKNNAVVSIVSGTPLSAAMTVTPLSLTYTIDEYLAKIAEAVANVK